jgi:hypothetical protein
MKTLYSLIIYLILTYVLFSDNMYTENNFSKFILDENDVLNLKIVKNDARGWCYDLDENEHPLFNPGFYQEINLNGNPSFITKRSIIVFTHAAYFTEGA